MDVQVMDKEGVISIIVWGQNVQDRCQIGEFVVLQEVNVARVNDRLKKG